MILVSATWLGPISRNGSTAGRHARGGAREIAPATRHRIEAETRDEVRLTGRGVQLDGGQLPRASGAGTHRVEMERKNSELDERRRYIETVLERIATGVVSIGPMAA